MYEVIIPRGRRSGFTTFEREVIAKRVLSEISFDLRVDIPTRSLQAVHDACAYFTKYNIKRFAEKYGIAELLISPSYNNIERFLNPLETEETIDIFITTTTKISVIKSLYAIRKLFSSLDIKLKKKEV